MESFITWLSTPLGMDLTHAVIVLVLAIAAYLQFKTHQAAVRAEKTIEDHVGQHLSERSTPSE